MFCSQFISELGRKKSGRISRFLFHHDHHYCELSLTFYLKNIQSKFKLYGDGNPCQKMDHGPKGRVCHPRTEISFLHFLPLSVRKISDIIIITEICMESNRITESSWKCGGRSNIKNKNVIKRRK